LVLFNYFQIHPSLKQMTCQIFLLCFKLLFFNELFLIFSAKSVVIETEIISENPPGRGRGPAVFSGILQF